MFSRAWRRFHVFRHWWWFNFSRSCHPPDHTVKFSEFSKRLQINYKVLKLHVLIFSKAGISDIFEGHYGPATGIDTHSAAGPIDFSYLFLTSSFDWTIKLWSHKVGKCNYSQLVFGFQVFSSDLNSQYLFLGKSGVRYNPGCALAAPSLPWRLPFANGPPVNIKWVSK